MGRRWIFDGHIAGLGTSSGLRAVVGVWQQSPFGAFSDVMLQQPSGRRLLLVPTAAVADFITATYAFDDVALVGVSARLERGSLRVDAGPLAVSASISSRTLLGRTLRAVPRPLAVHPRWLGAVPAMTFGLAASRPSHARLRTTIVQTGGSGDKSPSRRSQE